MPVKSGFSIVLVKPEIAGNTGSVGRTCVALGLRLILIKPYGFSLEEKALRRAGLDYWKHVNLTEYDSWQDFMAGELPERDALFFFSSKGTTLYYNAVYHPRGFLVFGNETAGLALRITADYPDKIFTLPMNSEKVRSLNLSNTVTAAAYESLRQLNYL